VVDQVEEEEEEEERSTPGHPRPLLPVEEWRWLLRLGVALSLQVRRRTLSCEKRRRRSAATFSPSLF